MGALEAEADGTGPLSEAGPREGEERMRYTRKRMAWLAALAVLALAGGPQPARGITIDLVGPAGPVALGDPVLISVVVLGLGAGAAPSLGAWDLDVFFDATRMSTNAGAVAFGDPVQGDQLDIDPGGAVGDGSDTLETLSLSAGTVELAQLAGLGVAGADLDAFQLASFVLAEITFTAIGPGPALFGVCNPVSDPFCTLADAFGQPLAFNVSGALVQTVPEPGIGLLLAVGGIAVLRRRPARA